MPSFRRSYSTAHGLLRQQVLHAAYLQCAEEALPVAACDELLRESDFREELFRLLELSDVRCDVCVSRDGDLTADVRTGRKDLPAAVLIDTAAPREAEAVLVYLEALMHRLRRLRKCAVVDVETGAAHVAEDEDLRLRQCLYVHVGQRNARRIADEGLAMHARDDVIHLAGRVLVERGRLLICIADDGATVRDILAEKRAVQPHDIHLTAREQRHAHPRPWPGRRCIREVLVVLRIFKIRPEHRRKVIGGAEQLESGVRRLAHILRNRGKRVPTVQCMGMGVTFDFVHSKPL